MRSQQRVQAGARMVEESAGGAILRPTAPTTFGQAGGGTGIKIAGQGQEACAQAPVAQGDGAEFVLGPIHRQGRRGGAPGAVGASRARVPPVAVGWARRSTPPESLAATASPR